MSGPFAQPTSPRPAPGVGKRQQPEIALRDHFAAQAIPTLTAEVLQNPDKYKGQSATFFVSKSAYEIADAMMVARAEDRGRA